MSRHLQESYFEQTGFGDNVSVCCRRIDGVKEMFAEEPSQVSCLHCLRAVREFAVAMRKEQEVLMIKMQMQQRAISPAEANIIGNVIVGPNGRRS